MQRIFYYHVPSAILGMIFPYINCAASLAFLYWRRRDPWKALGADALAVASAEVTLIFVTYWPGDGLALGEAGLGRLVGLGRADDDLSSVLWLLFASYLITRRFAGATSQGHTLAAVISIFAAIDVPISFMSIRWWRTQHPAPVFESGNLDPSFWPGILWNLAGWSTMGDFW